MKTCKCCRIRKQRGKFYIHLGMTDGRLNMCKECVKKRMRKYNQENADVLSKKEKRRYRQRCKDPTFQQKRTDYNRQWRTPDIMRAHNMTARKLKYSKPENCERCKTRLAQMAHHPDYSKPNEVEWICFRCHRRLKNDIKNWSCKEVAISA